VSGQMKQVRGFRQFLLRGLDQPSRMGDDLHSPQPPQARPSPPLSQGQSAQPTPSHSPNSAIRLYYSDKPLAACRTFRIQHEIMLAPN
jgi:hypothetical protein